MTWQAELFIDSPMAQEFCFILQLLRKSIGIQLPIWLG